MSWSSLFVSIESFTLTHCLVAMNTAHVIALFAGGVGRPLGKLGGALPFIAITTQLGCWTTLSGRPIKVSFTVLASPIAGNTSVTSCLTSSQVGAGTDGGGVTDAPSAGGGG